MRERETTMTIIKQTTHDLIDKRMADARARLVADIGELHDRYTRARERVAAPGAFLKSPWLKLGLGVFVGYVVTRRRTPALLTSGSDAQLYAQPAPAPQSGFIAMAMRAAVTALVGAAIQRAVDHLMTATAAPAADADNRH